MTDHTKLYYLTEEEAKRIQNWIAANGYVLNAGHFELDFSFSAYGDYIELFYFQGDNRHLLEVNNDCLADDPQRTVDHIVIDTQHVQLRLSDDALETYFRLSREITEAHVNADCEPPGSGLIFEIHYDHCNVLSGGRQTIAVR